MCSVHVGLSHLLPLYDASPLSAPAAWPSVCTLTAVLSCCRPLEARHSPVYLRTVSYTTHMTHDVTHSTLDTHDTHKANYNTHTNTSATTNNSNSRTTTTANKQTNRTEPDKQTKFATAPPSPVILLLNKFLPPCFLHCLQLCSSAAQLSLHGNTHRRGVLCFSAVPIPGGQSLTLLCWCLSHVLYLQLVFAIILGQQGLESAPAQHAKEHTGRSENGYTHNSSAKPSLTLLSSSLDLPRIVYGRAVPHA